MLLVLSPVLLLSSPLLVLYTLARSARHVARRLVGGGGLAPLHDPAVARVKTLRTWTAAVVSLAVLAAYGSATDHLDDRISEHWATLFLTPWLLIATGPVVFAVLIRWAPPPRRRAMRAALRVPLREFGRFIGVLAVIAALFTGFFVVTPDEVSGLPGLLVFAVVVLGIPWALMVILFASVAVARTGFGAAAVHPAAPAVLTSVLVWELAALGGLPGGPSPLAWLLLVGGPATVTAIAWWEVVRLRSRYGVRLRG
ncbi:hypothetical protein IHE55_24385 [Streptomyces pactum]|uniref:Integral membrane protein n=1 Tax=Streptomyces pactum TaxID=68249 RepID=A0ABS0NRQ5_9ACTN|nr:hypothetical protein [Streptomyces pactum]MBH5337742.1 hypothetical protein [Streptomyces pactum]